MRQIIFHLFVYFLIAIPIASANNSLQINLKDGRTIVGEVLSRENGQIKVQTESHGILEINETDIQDVTNPESNNDSGSAVTSGQSSPGNSGQQKQIAPTNADPTIRDIQDQMIKDKGIMAIIESLKNDPAFQKILQDPELMKAINSGDINAVMANPKFRAILNHSKVKDIQERMTDQ